MQLSELLVHLPLVCLPPNKTNAAGALEAAPAMGSADIILDLVSTGVTLRENNLKQLEGGKIMESQGALVANRRALLERPVSSPGWWLGWDWWGGSEGQSWVAGSELGGRARAGANKDLVQHCCWPGHRLKGRHAAHLPCVPFPVFSIPPFPPPAGCRACWRSAMN
jgi:hypothetical protein